MGMAADCCGGNEEFLRNIIKIENTWLQTICIVFGVHWLFYTLALHVFTKINVI